jgi:hypothetical protein
MSRLACALISLSCLFPLACGQAPPEGIRVGEDLFERTRYYDESRIGDVRSITVLFSERSQVVKVVVGGVSGAALLLPGGTLSSFVPFDVEVPNVAVLDLDKDGALEYMNRGRGWSAVGRLDAQGRSLWHYPSSQADEAADAMAAGDLDVDGDLEFVVGMNGSAGLRVLDERGIELWRRDATNVFNVEVLDIDKDGRPEIVHSQGRADGGIWIRSGTGDVIRRLRSGFFSFSLLRWPTANSEPSLLGVVNAPDRLQIVDFSGKTVAQFTLPDSGTANAIGTPVRFRSDGNVFLAVVRTIKATWRRSAFYVFDSHSNLIYHEILPASAIGLAVLPADSSGKEALLIGIRSTVWRYAMRTSADSVRP